MAGWRDRPPRSTGWWVAVGVAAGLVGVVLLRLAVAVVFGLVRLLLVVVAVVAIWYFVRRAQRGLGRR
ncbi:MAG: hypothetical protein ACSLFP_16115 [Acidimicrobiales bacterium]